MLGLYKKAQIDNDLFGMDKYYLRAFESGDSIKFTICNYRGSTMYYIFSITNDGIYRYTGAVPYTGAMPYPQRISGIMFDEHGRIKIS